MPYLFKFNIKTEMMINRIGLEKAKKELAGSIQKGVSFVKKWIGADILVSPESQGTLQLYLFSDNKSS